MKDHDRDHDQEQALEGSREPDSYYAEEKPF